MPSPRSSHRSTPTIRTARNALCSVALMVSASVFAPADTLLPRAALRAAAADAADLFPDPVVARGQGFEVKRSELDSAYQAFSAQEASRGRSINPLKRGEVETQILDRMIITRLLVKRSTDADKRIGKEKADKAVEDARREAASETSFQNRLLAMGTNAEQLKTRLYEQNVCEEVLNREVFSIIKISDDQLKGYYEKNPTQFQRPEMVRASHVLLSTRDRVTGRELNDTDRAAKQKLAEQVLAKAKAGDDFAQLARQYSDDPATREKGGEYTFARGRMVAEFETVAFSLKTNEISGLVTTRYGLHIIKCLEKLPARTVPLTEVSEEVRLHLQREQGKEKLEPYLERLRKESTVTVVK